jgi:hypothetical protein
MESNEQLSASFGRGYCSVNGELKGFAVLRNETATSAIGTTEAYITFIDSYEKLYKELDLSMSASITGFGAGSVSAKADYCRQTTIDNFSSHMLVKMSVSLRRDTLVNPLFSDSALALLNDRSKHPIFLDTFGNKFISDITIGGELYGVITFSNFNMEDKEYTDVQIQGQTGYVSGSAELRQRIEQVKKVSTAEIRIYRQGSVQTLPNYNDFLAYALQFPAEVQSAGGSEVSFVYSNYNNVQNRPTMEMPTLYPQEDAAVAIAQQQQSIISMQNTIKYILGHKYQFGKFVEHDLNGMADTLNMWRDQLDQLSRPLMRSPVFSNTVVQNLDFNRLRRQLPVEQANFRVPLKGFIESTSGTKDWKEDESVFYDWIEYDSIVGHSDSGLNDTLTIEPAIITRITGDFDVFVDDLAIMFQCKCVFESGGGGMRVKPHTVDSDEVPLKNADRFPSGMTGARFWLTGSRADKYSIIYQIRLNNGGEQPEVSDGHVADFGIYR